ncbi:MAG: hypothetical protein ACYCZO_02075 [Daejeonella sp.]
MNEREADVILDFLYLIPKNYWKKEKVENTHNQMEVELAKIGMDKSMKLLF